MPSDTYILISNMKTLYTLAQYSPTISKNSKTYSKARLNIMAEEAANAGTALVQLQALQAATGPVLDNLADFTHQGAPPTKGREAFMQQSKDAFRSPPGSVTPTVLTKPAPASA